MTAPHCPAEGLLRAIVFKTFGVADVLRKALLPLVAKIRIVFVHGSVAREEDTARSDIDVIIVGSISLMEAAKPLARAEVPLERRIRRGAQAGSATRVKQGGHNVPRVDVLRRFGRGWRNFQTVYQPLADAWVGYDNSGGIPRLLERGP